MPFSDQITNDGHRATWEDKQKEDGGLETLEKELAHTRMKLEAKESAYEQALHKLENQQRTADELAILLRRTDVKKDYYINECEEANARMSELESSLYHMSCKLSESQDAKEQLAFAMTELDDTRSELENLKKVNLELASRVGEMSGASSEEKAKGNELLRQVADMKEVIVRLQMKGIEMEREKADALSVKETELESAAKALSEAGEQLKMLSDLEARIADKTAYISSLQIEIEEVNELHRASQKAATEAIYEAKMLKEEGEVQKKKNSDQAEYVRVLEAEVKETRVELGNMNTQADCLRGEIEEMRRKFDKSTEKENDAQVEIALLKSELHKGRSKLAAAEAAEARAQAEKLALYNALQQMGLEAEETKKENRILKETMNVQHKEDQSDDKDGANGLQMAVVPQNTTKETEMLMQKIGELRTRAEQAISRAEAAEKAKFVLEEKAKRREQQKERRKAALAALQEESFSKDFENNDGMSIKYEPASPKHYQPLSKVLNMKF